MPSSFLPYHEPGIVTILIISCFYLALNLINSAFDKLIYCGLIGQIFIGVAWGTPGAGWLGEALEEAIVQFGYIGLILLVYEGGLDTNFKSVRANLTLSSGVALTGIAFPMGISFILMKLINATPLQSFAAGAALCSTSLGTTFTILSTSGLSSTRLGTVLTSSAMMDDVVGLVMVQVISNLGNGDFSAITIVRPVAVSAGLAVAVPLICRFVAQPLTLTLHKVRVATPRGFVNRTMGSEYMPLIMHTAILIALVTGATYAGTSNLFAAYLAGASISWWDAEVSPLCHQVSSRPVPQKTKSKKKKNSPSGEPFTAPPQANQSLARSPREERLDLAPQDTVLVEKVGRSGGDVFHKYYSASLNRVLRPLFFASIGFAIPITEMFSGEIVWRGVIYTILMGFGKLVTGLWLVRLSVSLPSFPNPGFFQKFLGGKTARNGTTQNEQHELQSQQPDGKPNTSSSPAETLADTSIPPTTLISQTSTSKAKTKHIPKPLSLYPASLLGSAMTARGEIGFLIASLAETSGLFAAEGESGTGSSQIYLVVVWAIVLCTILGPLGTGILVKRVRRLQNERAENPAKPEPLGVWGVDVS